MAEAVIRVPMITVIEGGRTWHHPKYRDPDRMIARRTLDWGTSTDESECTMYIQATIAQLESLALEPDVVVF